MTACRRHPAQRAPVADLWTGTDESLRARLTRAEAAREDVIERAQSPDQVELLEN